MSNRIQVLPSGLIDRIAAGEVVERPASVLKELVENSLDASAGRIFCRVEAGGTKLIQVTDDGEGMSAEDLALSVVRHATSKIHSEDDLERILTLGFRGEALPSIGAVSRLRIVSRRREDPAGSELYMEGGGPVRMLEEGAPVGTQVEVSDLFFNTPARRKFLKTPATEITHIQSWMVRLALMVPKIHLRLEHGQRTLLDAMASSDLAQRAAMVLNRQVYEHLFPVAFSGSDASVHGLASDPEITHPTARDIYLFVNGRFVRDRLLQHAVLQAYQTMLPPGRFPVAILHVQIDPTQVDVNVHPQKIEVRFVDSQKAHRLVCDAVADLLARSPWIRGTKTYVLTQDSSKDDAQVYSQQVQEALARYQASYSSGPRHAGVQSRSMGSPSSSFFDKTLSFFPVQGASTPWAYLGSCWGTYLLFCNQERLRIVDQHAAHERITFERLRDAMDQGPISAQRLLIPVQLALDSRQQTVLEDAGEKLNQLGFDISPFDKNNINITAVPVLLSSAPAGELVRDVLDELGEVGEGSPWGQVRLEVLSRMACHASIRAGQVLNQAEALNLLAQLAQVDFSGNCPHGRPVVKEFSRSEVEHWFHRA